MKNPRITQKEIEIIKRAQAGDMRAFNTLFYKYKGFVENILFKYLKDMDEARDITNVVFLKVYNKLSMFKAYNSFGGWLRIITNRTAVDYLRETKNQINMLPETEGRLTEDQVHGSAEDELVNHMTYDYLIKEIKKLPEINRKVCELFYIKNMTVVQIKDALNIPVGTIKSILFRTRSKLKKQLNI